MKAKLLKTAKGHYVLVDDTKETHDKGFLIGNSRESDVNKLSLNNCLEIENGYDLSALFCEVDESIDYHEFDFTSFRLGFQKALEILNKKFSEEDMIKISEFAKITSKTDPHITPKELVNLFTRSLQQTEWDVWVVMACGLPDGCTEPEVECTCDIIPSLDHDGCLILKRI
jgi:hypothetical protein